ncbi:MAG: hypothetical protein ACRDWE_05745 [Acidimicrobiales bacterium]
MDAEAYADMLPWLIFLVVNRKSGLDVEWAGGAAAVAALGLAAWSYWRGRRSPVTVAGVGIFTTFFVTALLLPGWDHMVTVPRALTVLAFSAVVFASLAFTPISEAYTAPTVGPDIRDDPRFRIVNLQMTIGWGVGALLVATACTVGRLADGSIAYTLCEWVLPLALAATTSLWATRRWELFRLSIDDTAHEPATTRVAVTGADRPTHREAVIRQFPLRGEKSHI